jgi:hypothetical protein
MPLRFNHLLIKQLSLKMSDLNYLCVYALVLFLFQFNENRTCVLQFFAICDFSLFASKIVRKKLKRFFPLFSLPVHFFSDDTVLSKY